MSSLALSDYLDIAMLSDIKDVVIAAGRCVLLQ